MINITTKFWTIWFMHIRVESACQFFVSVVCLFVCLFVRSFVRSFVRNSFVRSGSDCLPWLKVMSHQISLSFNTPNCSYSIPKHLYIARVSWINDYTSSNFLVTKITAKVISAFKCRTLSCLWVNNYAPVLHTLLIQTSTPQIWKTKYAMVHLPSTTWSLTNTYPSPLPLRVPFCFYVVCPTGPSCLFRSFASWGAQANDDTPLGHPTLGSLL